MFAARFYNDIENLHNHAILSSMNDSSPAWVSVVCILSMLVNGFLLGIILYNRNTLTLPTAFFKLLEGKK